MKVSLQGLILIYIISSNLTLCIKKTLKNKKKLSSESKKNILHQNIMDIIVIIHIMVQITMIHIMMIIIMMIIHIQQKLIQVMLQEMH